MNSPKSGDFMILKSSMHYCEHYIEYKIENQFEWDENKNSKNTDKHNVPFERIYDLIEDEHMLRMVEKSNKWEDVSKLDDSVERNEGNLDPVRGKLIGKIDNKLYTAIYTFRDEIGKIKCRIISLRRAQEDEIRSYENIKLIPK